MLQRKGLVISQPNHRVRIAELSSGDAEELYIMRIALEAVAIRVTVPILTAADLAEMDGLMAQMDHYLKLRDLLGNREPIGNSITASSTRPAPASARRSMSSLTTPSATAGASARAAHGKRRAEHRAILEARAEATA